MYCQNYTIRRVNLYGIESIKSIAYDCVDLKKLISVMRRCKRINNHDIIEPMILLIYKAPSLLSGLNRKDAITMSARENRDLMTGKGWP